MEHEPVAVADVPAAGPGGTTRPTTTQDRLQVAALVLLGLSLAVGAVRAMQFGWVPVGDEALIEMRVRDVPGHLPLLGVYSRFGWSHPGPAQFVLLALPYRLLGSVSAALLAGVLTGHLMAVAVGWWIARRIDRLAGALVLVAFEAVLICVPSGLVRSAWNPYVALLGAGLMVVVAWGWAERIGVAAVLLLPLATLLVQSHVGNLPLVAMVILASTPLALWWRTDVDAEPESRPVPWRAVGAGAVVAVVLWIPALVEQLMGEPGNVTKMVQDLSNDTPRVGVVDALGVTTGFFGWRPAWTDQNSLTQQIAGTGWVVPVWLALPVVALVVALRRRDAPMVRGLLISGVGVASTVVAAAEVKGVFFSYLIVGHRSTVVVCMAISVAALLRALPVSARSLVTTALAGPAVVLALTIGLLQWSAPNPSGPFDLTVRAVTSAVAEQADGSAVFITSTGDDPARDVASGLLLQLERAGIDATTVRDEDWRTGSHRTSDGVPDGALDVRIAPVGSERQLAEEGYRVLVEYQPFSADEVAAIDALVTERKALIRQGDSDPGSELDSAIRFVRIQGLADQIAALSDGRVSTQVGVRD